MNLNKLNCLVIGCGLLGLRRAEFIKNKVNIVSCCDNDLKKLNKEGLSDDSLKKSELQVQGLTDEFTDKVNSIFEQKEKDILTV